MAERSYFVLPAKPSAKACDGRVGEGWQLSRVFADGGSPFCIATWDRAGRAPESQDLDDLELFANENRRLDKEDPKACTTDVPPKCAPSSDLSKSVTVPVIFTNCGPARPACPKGGCKHVQPHTVGDAEDGALLTDLASGCPKCIVSTGEEMYAVLPPEYRTQTVSVSAPSGSGGVVQVDPGNEQVLVLTPPKDGDQDVTYGKVFFRDPRAKVPTGDPLTVTPGTWYEARKVTGKR